MTKRIATRKEEGFRRYLVPVLCGLIIVFRIIWPDIRFDQISILLFIVGVVVLLIPDVGEVVARIKKIKTPNYEVELENDLKQLADKAEKVEKEVETALEDPYTVDLSASELHQIVPEVGDEPRGKLVALAVQIEAAALALAEYYRIPSVKKLTSVVKVADELAKRELVPGELTALIRGFWVVRNRAVHSTDFELTDEGLYKVLDLGIRILKLFSLNRSYIKYAQRQLQSSDEADIIVGANILSELGKLEKEGPLLRKALKREDLSKEARETIERAIRDLERKKQGQRGRN